MKYILKYTGSLLIGFAILFSDSCTKLNETLYSQITSDNFLQTKDDVIRDFLRPFDQGYWSVMGGNLFAVQEITTDEIMTPSREGDWFDGGIHQRAHYHTWTPQDNYTSDMWTALFTGISLATNSMEDIQAIDAEKFGLTEAEKSNFIAQLRTLRAWFNLRALDLYRNIPIITKVKGESGIPPQSTPQETFDFIEKELQESIPALPTVEALGNNAIGQWTQAGAAALLMRLYFNAGVYIGQDKYTECAAICEDIINGKYGAYSLETRWDAPFDYTNVHSHEVIFGFASSLAKSHWHYDGAMYGWVSPFQAGQLFGFTEFNMNPRYALQPGRDVDSVEYPFALGKPFIKFQKYPDDYRLKKYKNLGNSQREGMFLYGYLPYYSDSTQLVKSKNNSYTIFVRDQVGHFDGLPPGQVLADKTSDMNNADENSGIYVIKYPFYPTPDPNRIASAFAEIRLAEVYYTLAECKYRAGDKASAAMLLNAVRARNYPPGSPSLYNPDGSQLNDQEILDEWGREFVMEGRRRIDLIRWGKFNSGVWWDKQPDADDHTKIFPIGETILNTSPQLVQNPGY
jgi:hypothetical protein